MRKLLFLLSFIAAFLLSCESGDSLTGENRNDFDSIFIDDDARNDDDAAQNDGEAPDQKNDDLADSGEIPDENGDFDSVVLPDEEEIVDELNFESGFIELESVKYTLDLRENETGRAMIWYNFQPADENPEEKPLFVFFNGGPGASSALLFTYNTAKMTGDQAFSGEDVVENPSNWNQMGNLLYIDARQTGFSYGLLDDVSNQDERERYFSTSTFNLFADAADFIRVVLRFIERRPKLLSSKIILVGESYGGTRATTMLNILLNVADYAAGGRTFYDEALFKEIADHFKILDPSLDGIPALETVKSIFGSQILIQPLIAGKRQFNASGILLEAEGSPLYEIESETGIDFIPCDVSNCNSYHNALSYAESAGRDVYSYRRPFNWLFDYTDVATQKMLRVALFEKFLQNNPRKIKELYAENRKNAFRYSEIPELSAKTSDDFEDLPENIKFIIRRRGDRDSLKPLASGDFETIFGDLFPYDEYYIDLNYTINALFYRASTTPYEEINGEMFLENIKNVKTFITQAEEDLIIYARGIPESLKKFDGVKSVEIESDSFAVTFSDGAKSTATFPFYPESSHSVSVNRPLKFFEDVKNWLQKP